MYLVTEGGIIKQLETWKIIIPIHDNKGIRFPQEKIDEIFEYISFNYPGFTIVNCVGFWKDQKQIYKDDNYQIIVDTVSLDSNESALFFSNLKSKLTIEFNQEKIYVTKTNDKQELLSFIEFFSEVGLHVTPEEYDKDKRLSLAKEIVSSREFIIKRLGYETVVLRRDSSKNMIVWERKICGLRLKSEFENNFPDEAVLIGADQIGKLGEAIFNRDFIVIIGNYEFQHYVLDKFQYKPLVEANIGEIQNDISFRDREGNLINTKKFIELFSMSIFCNYLALREENYHSNEIKINVGKDGSMQIGESQVNGNCLMHSPATISDKRVQLEVIRCLEETVKLFESNKLDSIALLQAKARNNYIKNRAAIRHQIKSRNN
jgi:hypothetical protein